jgi:predicted nuclease of predicted toxin-antitoxin system
MRLLADENFPKPIVEMLRAEGHDLLWARMNHAGARDVFLLDLAEAEARVVLTLDKDFWQTAVQRRSPLERSGVVLFQVHPATPERLAPLVHAFIAANTVWARHISIIHGRRNSNDRGRQKVNRPFRRCILQLVRSDLRARRSFVQSSRLLTSSKSGGPGGVGLHGCFTSGLSQRVR